VTTTPIIGVVTTAFEAMFPYEAILIVALVEKDGELKVLRCKDFADPRSVTSSSLELSRLELRG
jgi:hypothetical protein